MSRLLLGLDIGSSFVKAALVDAETGDARRRRRRRPTAKWRSPRRSPAGPSRTRRRGGRNAVAATRDGDRPQRPARVGDLRHRHLLPDARPRRRRPPAAGAAAGDHLVRRPRRRHRRARVRRDRPAVVPRPPAQLPGQLHRLEAPLGEGARAGRLRVGRQGHAARRLHRHEADRPRRDDGVRPVGGDPLGLPRRAGVAGRARRLRAVAVPHPRGRADLRRAGSA